MILSRALAVLAAANTVAAFALATLLPPMLPLSQLVEMASTTVLPALHGFAQAHMSSWVWTHLLLPLLTRPCWLLPASFGIVFAGGAMTLASLKGVPRSHRRRS